MSCERDFSLLKCFRDQQDYITILSISGIDTVYYMFEITTVKYDKYESQLVHVVDDNSIVYSVIIISIQCLFYYIHKENDNNKHRSKQEHELICTMSYMDC